MCDVTTLAVFYRPIGECVVCVCVCVRCACGVLNRPFDKFVCVWCEM